MVQETESTSNTQGLPKLHEQPEQPGFTKFSKSAMARMAVATITFVHVQIARRFSGRKTAGRRKCPGFRYSLSPPLLARNLDLIQITPIPI